MTLFIVRHGKAGDREKWDRDDELRPLSKGGVKQADALADWLERESVAHILTSPAVRCRQTVEPLAQRTRVALEASDAIREGARLDETLALIDKVCDEHTVLCTHGDVIGNLLWHLESVGVRLECHLLQKASTWVLDVESGGVIAARYVPPLS